MNAVPAGSGLGDSPCPRRRLDQPGELAGPAVEQVPPAEARSPEGIHGPRWVVRSYEVARELIRSEQSLKQAGFGALTFIRPTGGWSPDPAATNVRREGRPRPPVLYLEGAEHRERRRSAARFFTPKAVASYETMIDDLTHKQIAPLVRGRRADVSQMSLQLSVAVVARVVGLTSSVLPGKSRRIEATFTANLTADGPAPLALLRRLCTVVAVLLFYLVDVLPAIRTRRRRPGNDLITHLLDVGLRPLEVLTECIIYCAAGMATTREHITIAAWHLLDCPDLLTRFRTGAHAERAAVLQEILRLEPVVGHFYRQVTAPTPVLVDGSPTVLDEGTLIDFDLRAINADVQLVGAEPLALRPGRVLTSRRAAPSVMSFGDGNHRCPGGPLAMLESEIFLDRLLALDLIVDQTPKIAWNDLTGGYELRELVVRQTRQDET